jgi:hypothetical protein
MSNKDKNKENMDVNDNNDNDNDNDNDNLDLDLDLDLDIMSFKNDKRIDKINSTCNHLIHHPYKISLQDRQYVGMLGYDIIHWMDIEKENHKKCIKQRIKPKKKNNNKCYNTNDFTLL